MLYVEIDASGNARHINYAPYLDYRPLAEGEPGIDALLARPECTWIGRDLEQKAQGYAVAHVVPEHLDVMPCRDFYDTVKDAIKEGIEKSMPWPGDIQNAITDGVKEAHRAPVVFRADPNGEAS